MIVSNIYAPEQGVACCDERITSQQTEFQATHGTCTLQLANEQKVKGNNRDYATRHRCKRLSCPACSSIALSRPIRAAAQVSVDWSFPHKSVTLNLPTVSVKTFNVAAIEQIYESASKLAKALAAHPDVIAYLVKVELAQGRQMPDKSVSVLLHVQADIMLTEESAWKAVKKCIPPELKEKYVQGVYSGGWVDYLGKPYICRPKENRSEDVLRAISVSLDQFQKQTGVSQMVWRGGWYNRHRSRWIVFGAAVAKALADKSLWVGIDGRMERIKAAKAARHSEAVKKWSFLAPWCRAYFRVSATPEGKLRAKRVKSKREAMVVTKSRMVKPHPKAPSS